MGSKTKSLPNVTTTELMQIRKDFSYYGTLQNVSLF